MDEIFIWRCINCEMRVQTFCDFHINERPICVECNAEMEPQPPLSDEEVAEFMRRLGAITFERNHQ